MSLIRRGVILAALLPDARVSAAGCPEDPEIDLCGEAEETATSGGLRLGSYAFLLPSALGGSKVQTMMLLPLVSLQIAAAAGVDTSGVTKDMKCIDIKNKYKEADCCGKPEQSSGMTVIPAHDNGIKFGENGNNPCDGKKPTGEAWDNTACIKDNVVQAAEQSGTDVTVGYTGQLNATNTVPITDAYFNHKMCPVNVHWHLGAEHRSAGEFDETFWANGPKGQSGARRLAGADAKEGTRTGFRCKHYDATDEKFTKAYDFKHCKNMTVGETYEVHWPHSSAGLCGTPWQYQSPFYNGVFCHDATVTYAVEQIGLGNFQVVADNIGVQGQVFTIVNDEKYFYPELFRGWIQDGEFAKHVTKYTGSTTGTSRNNAICSKYAPITWQVDRKCHMISASSFDKMCADMKAQAADMRSDLYPHGARALVDTKLAANNHQNRRVAETEESAQVFP